METLWSWLRRQPRHVRIALVVIVVASLLLNTIGIGWGLPNDNRSWSADALQPLTPLSVGRHVLFGDSWNSGWFYFKYPVGHPMLLLAAQSPLLVAKWLTGELGRPQAQYPFGFRNPEKSLAELAIVMRIVSAFMGTLLVFLAFCAAAILLGSGTAGLWASVTVAGLYPVVFYSHTSNVDIPLLCWLALGFVAVLWSARNNSLTASAVGGISAAMALLTKEQGIGFLLALPLVWILVGTAQHGSGSVSLRHALRHGITALVAFVVTTSIVANVLWNPSGYFNRWRFLMGTLPAEVRDRYAPYQFLTQVPQEFSWAREAAKAGKTVAVVGHTLGPVVSLLGLVGCLLWACMAGRSFLAVGITAVTYYLVSLRALELVQVRYALPAAYLASLTIGGTGVLLERLNVRPVISGAMLFVWGAMALAPGVETVRLLLRDPRYAAERWFAEQWPAHGVRAEIYQPLTYLPRFPQGWEVRTIPLEDRTKERFAERAPDLIVLSSGGRAGLTGTYRRDWRPGEAFFRESPASIEFFRALRSGTLGYELSATFATPTWLQTRIPSLNPTISVYTRRSTP
ncbi:MAG: phospholipid carrier-dependent glycosyltransferase [Candidatus Binatia bacterium]|nr:phospholipid carrier-dependent glycosyltransferase [Candidatus Binatia bacterium]